MNMEVESCGFIDAIMEPHLCYYKSVRGLFDLEGLHGMSHITGGGIQDNLARILPSHVNAAVDLSKINILPLFKLLRTVGNVDEKDMLRTFNMGVGMIMVLDSKIVGEVQMYLSGHNLNSYLIGEIISGDKQVMYQNKLVWDEN